MIGAGDYIGAAIARKFADETLLALAPAFLWTIDIGATCPFERNLAKVGSLSNPADFGYE